MLVRFKKSDSQSILLGDIATDKIGDRKDVGVAECVTWLEASLLKGSIIVVDQSDLKYRIDLAITYMDPGSAAKRIWAGELGAGHAQVQVEGKVFDIESGQIVATFAERKRSSGAIGLKDIGGDAGPSLIKQMLNLISEDVNDELLATFSSS